MHYTADRQVTDDTYAYTRRRAEENNFWGSGETGVGRGYEESPLQRTFQGHWHVLSR